MKSALKCVVWFTVLCAGVRIAAAHHSATMYALNQQIVVDGTITTMRWNKRSLDAGERVRIQLAPLRDGKPGGLMRKITRLDTGEVLEWTFADGEKPESYQR